jgi:hypothetical protein
MTEGRAGAIAEKSVFDIQVPIFPSGCVIFILKLKLPIFMSCLAGYKPVQETIQQQKLLFERDVENLCKYLGLHIIREPSSINSALPARRHLSKISKIDRLVD